MMQQGTRRRNRLGPEPWLQWNRRRGQPDAFVSAANLWTSPTLKFCFAWRGLGGANRLVNCSNCTVAISLFWPAPLDRRLRRLSPADLVQETMLAAHRDFAKFHGATECQFRAWLRKILVRCLYHSIETHLKSKRRDVRCEVPIEQIELRFQRAGLEVRSFDPVDGGALPGDSAHRREESRGLRAARHSQTAVPPRDRATNSAWHVV